MNLELTFLQILNEVLVVGALGLSFANLYLVSTRFRSRRTKVAAVVGSLALVTLVGANTISATAGAIDLADNFPTWSEPVRAVLVGLRAASVVFLFYLVFEMLKSKHEALDDDIDRRV